MALQQPCAYVLYLLLCKKAMKKRKQMPVKYKLLGMGNVNDYLWERSLDLIQSPGCYAVEIEHTDSYMGVINKWKDNGGKVVHLTMYGSQAHEVAPEIREDGSDILIIVGGSKVPGKVYKAADWNVSVTTQPHSEVSSLAVFQHLLMDGKEFDLEFENPVFEVIPTAHGKNVNIHDENR